MKQTKEDKSVQKGMEIRNKICKFIIAYTEQEYIPFPDTSVINDIMNELDKAVKSAREEWDKEQKEKADYVMKHLVGINSFDKEQLVLAVKKTTESFEIGYAKAREEEEKNVNDIIDFMKTIVTCDIVTIKMFEKLLIKSKQGAK